MTSTGNVKVAVRVRPLNGTEKSEEAQEIVSLYPNNGLLKNEMELGDKRFAYDYVLGQKSSQEQVYDSCIADLLSGYLSGYNATVMAYGQTGSGKTFTMGTGDGNSAWGESKQDRGILPRVIYNLFDKLATKDCDWELRTSFVEIYNEQIKDLLSNSSSGEKEKEGSGSGAGSKHHRNNKGPAIREAADGSIKMTGVVEEEVESAEAMLGCLHRGSLNRSTGKTAMNSHSSRSHAIFSVYLRMTGRKKNKSDETETSKSNDNNNSADAPMNTSTGSGAEKLNDSTTSTAEDEDEDEDDDVITAKFHFVDLAGSERLKRTGAVGARMREGISINCGLLALANVISALTEGSGNSGDTSGGSNNGSGSGSGSGKDKSAQRQRVHVPFRDSKITRLLQDSLGGNSNTLMIACVSPANTNGDETTSTLRYAARARNIKNQARVNRDPNQEKMLKMRMRIRELETQLTLAGLPVPKRSSSSSTLASSSSSSASSAEAVKHVVVSVSNEELQLLRDQCTLYEKEMMRLTSQCSELRRTLSERSDSLLIMTREKDVLQVKLQKRTSAHSSGDGEASNHASMDVDAADVDVAAEVDAMSEVRRENLQLRDQIAALKKQLYLKRLSSLSSSFTSEDSGGDLETSGEMECGNDDDSNMVRNDTADADADMDSEGENEAHSLDLEQEAVNEEVKGIESLSALKTREHDLRMRQLKQAKSAIKGDLHQQQALVDELTVTQRKHAMMQKQYLSKVKSMTAEVQTIEKQRDELLLKIEQEKAKAKGSSGSGSNNGSDKASSLRIQRFADKVKTLESELSKFRGKLKTHERLKQQFKDNQKKIERLNAGIDKGKQNQIKLTRQMRDKAEIYRLWMKEKDNRVKSLMKESRKQKIQMQRLQDAMSKQTAVLKRASEERSHLQSKLRRKEDVTARADKMRAARKLHKSKRDRVRAMNGGDSLDAIKKKKRRINNFTNNGAGSSTSRGNYVVTKETTSKPLKTKREGAGGLKSVGSTSAAGSGSLTARNVKKGKSNYMSSTLASQTGKVQRRKSDKDREMEGREKRKKAKLNTSGGSLSNTAAATDKPKQLKKRRRSFTGMIQPLSRHLDGRGAGADKPAKMNTSGGVNGDENSNTDATSSKNDSFAAPSSQLSMKEKLALYKQQKVQHVTSTSSTSSPSSTNDGADSFPTQSTHHSYNHQHPSDTSAHTDSSPSSNTAANSKKKDKAQSVVSTLKTELLETLNNGDLKELQKLAAIGKKRAEQILALREKNKTTNQSLMVQGKATRLTFVDLSDLTPSVFTAKQTEEFFKKNMEKQYLNRFWTRNEADVLPLLTRSVSDTSCNGGTVSSPSASASPHSQLNTSTDSTMSDPGRPKAKGPKAKGKSRRKSMLKEKENVDTSNTMTSNSGAVKKNSTKSKKAKSDKGIEKDAVSGEKANKSKPSAGTGNTTNRRSPLASSSTSAGNKKKKTSSKKMSQSKSKSTSKASTSASALKRAEDESGANNRDKAKRSTKPIAKRRRSLRIAQPVHESDYEEESEEESEAEVDSDSDYAYEDGEEYEEENAEEEGGRKATNTRSSRSRTRRSTHRDEGEEEEQEEGDDSSDASESDADEVNDENTPVKGKGTGKGKLASRRNRIFGNNFSPNIKMAY